MEAGPDEAAAKEEEAMVRAFVIPSRRERLLEQLRNPKRRNKATGSLDHFRHLDSRRVVLVPGVSTPAVLERLLRKRGAGGTCHVISSNPRVDGRRMPLGEALRQVVGRGYGSLLSCVPGVLGYLEGEGPDDRCILAKATR